MREGEFEYSGADPEYFLATVVYRDGERFGSLYTTREDAERFAAAQQALPDVQSVKVEQIGGDNDLYFKSTDMPLTIN